MGRVVSDKSRKKQTDDPGIAEGGLPAIPQGLRDILPTEAIERDVVERSLRESFEVWGYEPVETPAFEYYETLATEAGEGMRQVMFKFLDCAGQLLALRPEVTTPIARMVASRFADELPPYRLFYLANVFREEKPQRGQQREFRQAGIELVGSRSEVADAEVVALMIEALIKLGLRDFRVGLGQIEIFKGALEIRDLPEESAERLKNAVASGDLVALEEIARAIGLDAVSRDKLVAISKLRGGEEVLLEAEKLVAGEASRSALDSLGEVYRLLKGYGVGRFVLLDLGIIRNFDYYTGIIFEAYAEGVGFPVGGGGRYDNLLAEFGVQLPAAGFALGVERLHIALAEQNRLPVVEETKGMLFWQADPSRALRIARQLREKDIRAEIALSFSSGEAAENLARQKRARWLLIEPDSDVGTGNEQSGERAAIAANDALLTLMDLKNGRVTEVREEDVLNAVRGFMRTDSAADSKDES